ncbi:MAG: hypothetical protein Q9Q40_12430 [Acidobacteriota bacterium]|nr:hypothetical protein [Acidobacteriota bacterium]MDQ7088685.1 hypothetical protein [Acidobacteriota bacterium]
MRLTCLLSTALAAAAGFVCIVGYAPRPRDGRCRAVTRQGERCRRPARPGQQTCAQHAPR